MLKAKLKNIVRKILLSQKKPFFCYLAIFILANRNRYVEISFLGVNLYRKIKELNGFTSYSLTTTGVLILFHPDRVVKIPLCTYSLKSLKKDFEFYTEALETKYNRFFDYKLSKKEDYFEMDYLAPFNSTAQFFFREIEDLERSIYLDYEKTNKSIERLKFLFPNLSDIEVLSNISVDKRRFYSVTMGFMHGDLTNSNIMYNKSGKICLIDLDRATLIGIREIDYIHNYIDAESKKNNKSFFSFIFDETEALSKRFGFEIVYLYLIFRTCQEYRPGIILDSAYYQSLKQCHDKLVKNL